MSLSNAQLAELLAMAAEGEQTKHRQTALGRAARAAMYWEEEAADVAAGGHRSLTELRSVGPWLARIILRWLEDPPEEAESEPPPLRRGFLTLSEVRRTLAEHPDWTADLRADLQMHTTYSDGKATVREMSGACADVYHYSFVAITDHSKSLKIARGMDEQELAEQAEDISHVNLELRAAGVGLRVLHSIEMDISPEGVEDMDRAALARLDLAMGAFHSKLRLTEDQTERYLAALRNPTIDRLAHPRGRRFNTRMGLTADWERVFAEAASLDKAMEIDAYPDRQDLDVELLKLAREAGIRISIGTDAHSVGELRFMEFGLAAAIKAGIPKERILNFQPLDDVLAWSAGARALPAP